MPMFPPTKPFVLHEDGMNYGKPGKYSAFVTDLVKTQIEQGAPLVYVYRLRGTFDQDRNALGILNDAKGGVKPALDIGSFMGIQDPVLGENRDREYDMEEVPMLRGVYQISQNELEYARFGLALSNDIITMEFHLPTVETELGRRFIPGDVIEMPHLRDVGIDGRVANKWYEVASPTFSPSGYDAFYIRHVIAVVLRPMRHQQEFLDLFERRDQYGKTLAEQASNLGAMINITAAVQEIAREQAPTVWWDTTIMWFDPDDPSRKPERFIDDAKPDNGLPVNQGVAFPADAQEGDWFLRVDLDPNRLYRLQGGRWKLREVDRKREWQPYNWTAKLREFMSDRSEADRTKKHELRSIHDVLTDREERSDPTGDELTKKKLGYKT